RLTKKSVRVELQRDTLEDTPQNTTRKGSAAVQPRLLRIGEFIIDILAILEFLPIITRNEGIFMCRFARSLRDPYGLARRLCARRQGIGKVNHREPPLACCLHFESPRKVAFDDREQCQILWKEMF